MESTLSRSGQWLFVRRGWLPWLLFPLLLLPAPPPSPAGWFLIGSLIALGEGIRFWSVGFAGTRTRTRLQGGDLDTLVTNGPYGYVRNPIYVGNLLMVAGYLLLFGLGVWALPLLVAAVAAYQPIVRFEERILAHAFGESYARFLETVPRWVPRLTRSPLRSVHPFLWQQALFSERGTLGSILIVFLLYGLKRWLL